MNRIVRPIWVRLMETSLHQQLKSHYASSQADCEVRLGGYRVDVVRGDELVEIQHASLTAIRDKVRELLTHHRVLVVKPLVARKLLVKHASRGGPVVGRRLSPKQGQLLDIFDELVHFTHVFPHPGLTLEVLLVEVEEHRYPGHGRRRRWRRDDHEVDDQLLVGIQQRHPFCTAEDLLRILPALPRPFHTADLAQALGLRRFRAQRSAYCLPRMGAVRSVGKQGNAVLYEVPTGPHRRERPRRASA